MPLKDGKLLLVGHSNAKAAGGWLRIGQSLENIRADGLAHCRMMEKDDDADVSEKAILNADVLCSAHGVSEGQAKRVLDLIAAGKRYFWDVDDLPTEVSPYNPSYRSFGLEEVKLDWGDGREEWLWRDGFCGFDVERNRAAMAAYHQILKNATALSTTQPYLAGKLVPFNSRVYIRPNVIDFKRVFRRKVRPSRDGKVRIMYMGGSSHLKDLEMVLPVLEAVAKEYPHVKFMFFGDTKGPASKFIPEGRIEFTDWSSDYEMFALKLASLAPDIGIAPLCDKEPFAEFNRCKSNLKWLDYAACGIPCVAQNMTPYKEHINFGAVGEMEWNGMLANTPEDWLHCLSMLIENPDARQVIGRNAYREAYENWNAEKWTPEFFRQYEEVANG